VTTTSTYAFNPAASNLMLTAFGRCGIRRSALTPEHFADAYNEANLIQVLLANKQPNLWTDELYEVELEEGTATYELNARLIAIQAAFITTDNGDDTTTDRIVWPYSTFEYAAIPNKEQQAPPTAYWYQRLITPQITVWPVPDADETYTLKLRVCRQIQDVSLKGSKTLDLPYRWLDVWVAEMAYRMARIYAPDREDKRKLEAKEAWDNAATEDQENTPIYLAPSLSSYWR
jgi:hypothetical protein